MKPNPHMTPPRAPFRGSYSQQQQARPAQQSPFASAAAARMGKPNYPDPSWQPKGTGNALPAQHAMQQQQDAPAQGPMGAYAGPSGAQKATGAGGMFAQAAAARVKQAPPAAQYQNSMGAGTGQKPKTAVGVATEDLERYAGIRDASMQNWQAAASARAKAAEQAKQQAGENAWAAMNGAVTGVFEALADPTTPQPAPGWDWQEGRGWMPQEEGIDTPKEGIDENFLDLLAGSPEDFLMPDDVKKKKEAALFTEAAAARRRLNDQLGARGIAASGIAASQLGGIDVGTQQALGEMEAADWAQAQEAYANRLATLGDLAMKGLSEENRMKVLEAQTDSEKQAAAWTAAQEFAASIGADRWSPEALQAYWKHILAGKSPEEAAASMFTTIGEGDENVVITQPDTAGGDQGWQQDLASKEVQSDTIPADVAGAGYTQEAWAGFTPEERLMIINMVRTGVAG